MKSALFSSLALIILAACNVQDAGKTTLGKEDIEASLSPDKQAIASNYRDCLNVEMAGGASFSAAGEGCAGVWTMSFESIVEDVAADHPSLSIEQIRDSVARYQDDPTVWQKPRKNNAPNK